MAKTSGIVSIHGKEYATVAYRLQLFREINPNGHIITSLESDDGTTIVMKCEVYLGLEEYKLPTATGWAEEVRGSSNINKTSALENCETSAVGRALAFVGYHGSNCEVASADEVAIAIERQKNVPAKKTEAKETPEQRIKAIEDFLDSFSDGDLKLERLLVWGGKDKDNPLDNLSELSDVKAKKWIKQNMKVDVIA